MASELSWRHTATGKTLYATARGPDQQSQYYLVPASGSLVPLVVANWATYKIALTETPAASYLYVGDWPASWEDDGQQFLWIDFFEQAAGSPAISDTIIGGMLAYWDGYFLHPWAADVAQWKSTPVAASYAGALPADVRYYNGRWLGSGVVGADVDDTAFQPTAMEFEATFDADLPGGNLAGRVITFTQLGPHGQQCVITAYSVVDGRGHFTVRGLSQAPAVPSRFVIVPGAYLETSLPAAIAAIPTNPLTSLGTNAPAGWLNAAAVAADLLLAIANKVEAEIIDETDSEKVLTAITAKIAAVNPSLAGLTLAAIASQVRTELTTELARIDAAITTRHAAGAAVAKSPATLDWSADVTTKPTAFAANNLPAKYSSGFDWTDVSNKPAIGTSTLVTADLDARLAAWGKSDFSLSAAGLLAVATKILELSAAAIEGDTIQPDTLYAVILQHVRANTTDNAGKLTTLKSTGAEFHQYTIPTDADAAPVTGIS